MLMLHLHPALMGMVQPVPNKVSGVPTTLGSSPSLGNLQGETILGSGPSLGNLPGAVKGLTSHFPSVEGKIPFEGPKSRNPLAFKYYEPERDVLGKPMKDWLRFAVAYWHTWRGNGADIFGLDGTMRREWEGDDPASLEAAMRRVDAHFEFCQKLGIEYYCFHDRDV